MEIGKRIVITFVTVSLIPILIISALSVNTIFGVSQANANDSSQALLQEEIANLQRISNDTAIFIDERMEQYFDGVYMMEHYAEDLFNGVINATPRYSYFWDPMVEAGRGHPVPGLTNKYYEEYGSTQISFDVSCYYMPRTYYKTPGDPFDWSASTKYFIETSSNMDNVFRSLHQMVSDYIWLYMGFDDQYCDSHLFRNYPYDNLNYFLNWYGPNDDYDPLKEDWYKNAATITNNSVAFTKPYGDPSTGLVISMGRPARFANGSLFGVVSADVSIDTLVSSVTNIKVLQSGYAFLLTKQGDVIAHPGYSTEGKTIYDLEMENATTQENTTFHNVVNTITTSPSGIVEYYKNGEKWYLAYTKSSLTGFVLAIVVPANEVVAPAVNILNRVQSNSNTMIFLLIGVLALVAIVVTKASYSKAEAVVQPIRDMTRLVKKMSKQDFTRGVYASGAMFEEVGTTVDALMSFQEACRFGNEAFVRGDLNRALKNYQNLLEISQRLNIKTGIQTMYLNIGNVFRQRGEIENALEYYNKALAMAKEMLERAKEDGADETDAMDRIASAYHNIALVEMDRENYDVAIQHLEDAEAIDKTLGNRRGLAKRYDAMGLVFMHQGRDSEALSKFNEAIEIATDEQYDRSLAYIHFHLGEFYIKQERWQDAEEEFTKAIQYGEKTDEKWLVVYAMNNLADVYDQLDKSSHELRVKAERLRRSIQYRKSVTFVIDYSGSMRAEGRIRAAIAGAKEILNSQINPQDQVGIIIFNSEYRELLPLTPKGDYEDPDQSPIIKALDSLKYPNSATAFYDALGRALESLDAVESSEHRWVIALTDGEDNSSRKYSLDWIEGIYTEKDRRRKKRKRPTIEGFIKQRHLDVNLIIIGVGHELKNMTDPPIYRKDTKAYLTIEDLLRSVCENVPQGQYISVVDSRDVQQDLQQAFQQVGVMMAQLEVGGSTVDY